MSEYQYYEFQTIDQPLSAEQQAVMRQLSSRVKLSASRAAFNYSYGDFRGDPLTIAQGSGLLVTISFVAAQQDDAGVAYRVAKAVDDRMVACMAHELRPHHVAVDSLYPGLVRTETVLEAGEHVDLSNSESPQFIGRAAAALAADPASMERSGQVLVAAALPRCTASPTWTGRSRSQ